MNTPRNHESNNDDFNKAFQENYKQIRLTRDILVELEKDFIEKKHMNDICSNSSDSDTSINKMIEVLTEVIRKKEENDNKKKTKKWACIII